MTSEGLPEFLFEVASPERLGILDALGAHPMKHADIARGLGMTGSETTRHLRRLLSAGLVSKEADGRYCPTALAEALRAGLPFFDFLVRHRRFVQLHHLPELDHTFLERMGELCHGSVLQGAYQVVAVQESALRAVERRIWVITEQRFEAALPILREKAGLGADVRVVRPKELITAEKLAGREVHRNFSLRVLPRVDSFLAVLDDQAGFCLPGLDGKVDLSAMLLLTDADGYRWAEDLYRWYWEKAEAWRPSASADAAPARAGSRR